MAEPGGRRLAGAVINTSGRGRHGPASLVTTDRDSILEVGTAACADVPIGAAGVGNRQIFEAFQGSYALRIVDSDEDQGVTGPALGPRVRRSSGWYVDVPQRDEYDTELLVRELLDVIEPHAEELAHAKQVLGLRAGINVVIEMRSGRDRAGDILVTTPAFHLTAATMRRLASLDLWLDCDQYVY